MTPEDLAKLHALCLSVPRPYSALEFRDLLATDPVFLCPHSYGFALGRVITDEAELLTLAVHPEHRRMGVARALLRNFEGEAGRRGARTAFLEVAADNAPALALYRGAGYAVAGRRPGYYRGPGATATDAVLMRKALSAG